jgi:hypothetical protein
MLPSYKLLFMFISFKKIIENLFSQENLSIIILKEVIKIIIKQLFLKLINNLKFKNLIKVFKKRIAFWRRK